MYMPLQPPLRVLQLLAKLRDGSKTFGGQEEDASALIDEKAIWVWGQPILRKISPLFPGKSPYRDNPFQYLFEDETPSSSVRAARVDFRAWIKDKLNGTRADTLDQDLNKITSDLGKMIRSVQATSPNIFFSFADAKGGVTTHVSEWIEDLTGYTPKEFCGRNCRFLQGPGTDTRAVQEIREVCISAPHKPVEVALRNYKKDGSPFWNLLSIDPIMDDIGQVKTFLGVQTDVTNIVELIARNSTPADEDTPMKKQLKQAIFSQLFDTAPSLGRRHQYAALSSPH